MVVIRLSRGGAKKKPFYHLVVTDSRNCRDGKYIEKLGFFNPVASGKAVAVQLDRERITHWQKNGAQLSQRVAKIVKDWDKDKSAA